MEVSLVFKLCGYFCRQFVRTIAKLYPIQRLSQLRGHSGMFISWKGLKSIFVKKLVMGHLIVRQIVFDVFFFTWLCTAMTLAPVSQTTHL